MASTQQTNFSNQSNQKLSPQTQKTTLFPARRRFVACIWALVLVLVNLLAGCGTPEASATQENQRTAEEKIIAAVEKRIFLDLSLEFLDVYELPQQTFQETPIGGLSSIIYDRQRNLFYALSDDPSNFAPARFYTLKLALNSDNPNQTKIQNIEIQNLTTLKAENGEPFPRYSINPEGIAFVAPNEIFVSSEGISSLGIEPFVQKFDLNTGRWLQTLPIPNRYLANPKSETLPKGVQNNLGFESLAIKGNSGEPYRLFTATEAPLEQDKEPADSILEQKNRLLHYLLGEGPPVLISEHFYPLDRGPKWSIANGLTELLVLDQGGHFLSLERSLGFLGYGAKIFQIATGSATDTSGIPSLKGELKGIEPVKKKLLLDLSTQGISLDNLEGMTLGPRLPDGTQSLILVSDNNFDEGQVTQFLLFRLKMPM
ncbi:esterase-like activity of phytase family protein [Ancylothrix sp. C2]|uniref:esterase-like activity of phytase family protein n=1 Tax=Ancylothrix sp. D3o TaxID=2953691 RepID=UPI0021BA69BE|nr:esterase-like activity of phytase family protein [Ancylothrix sp. D3o]MCT7948697.1 esterase-like activity of phytase family protein [Ancylothrix sp. D3o]